MTTSRVEGDNSSDAIGGNNEAYDRDAVVERIVAEERFCYAYEVTFEHPEKPKAVKNKFLLAQALIEDPQHRFSDHEFLLSNFIPHGAKPTDEARQYLDTLYLSCLRLGLPVTGKESQEYLQDAIWRYVQSDEELEKLSGVVPIEVMDAVARTRLTDTITDDEKRRRAGMMVRQSLIRPYLGDLIVHRAKKEMEFDDLVKSVPDTIFQDTTTASYNIICGYFTKEALKLFRESSENDAFSKLYEIIALEESDVKKEVLESIVLELEHVRATNVPEVFKDIIEGRNGELFTFPHFRQKYFLREFLKTKRKLINGGTGATKTACAYLGMEAVGAERVTVFGPAIARDTWPKEAKKLFKDGHRPEVFTVERIVDLDDPRIVTAKYVYISTGMLSQASVEHNPELQEKIKRKIIEERNTDGVIIDESAKLKNPDAECTKIVSDIVQKLDAQYVPKHDLDSGMPMVALTATPISSSLEDMDVVMGMLYPDRFSLPGAQSPNPVFSRTALKDPRIAHDLLFGEKLIIQWSAQDLFGDKIPVAIPERHVLPISPAQRVIYDWVVGLQLDSFSQINLLRTALLDPEIIKTALEQKGLLPIVTKSRKELRAEFDQFHLSWLQWSMDGIGRAPGVEPEKFSADWIAKMGGEEFILECFFSKELPTGVESLAYENNMLYRTDWEAAREPSAKYEALKRYLQENLQGDAKTGFYAKTKTLIVSPYRRTGITRNMLDSRVREEDLRINTISLYERMISDWFPGVSGEIMTAIDGTKTFRFRNKHASTFGYAGDKNLVVLATIDSIGESMDWSVYDSENNANIEQIDLVFLGYTWGADELEQMIGRIPRIGMAKRYRIIILEGEHTIDQGMRDDVERKRIYTKLALSGVELEPEEQEFFDRNQTARRILLATPEAGQVFVQGFLRNAKGLGERAAQREFARESRSGGKSLARLFAEFYFDEGNDQYRLTGNNAEMVKNILLEDNPENIISVGAGSCLFARKARETGYTGDIDNVDINLEALELAKKRYPTIGTMVVEGATKLSAESDSKGGADYSYMLHWSKIFDHGDELPAEVEKAERVKVLTEMNRVLRDGAKAVITVPKTVLDEETFTSFTQVLTNHFGFTLLPQSGRAFATDLHPPRDLGWVITVQKTGTPDLNGLDLSDLIFLSDPSRVVSKYKAKPEGKEPKVVHVGYPIFDAKRFEIHNPITEQNVQYTSTYHGDVPVSMLSTAIMTLGGMIERDELFSERADEVVKSNGHAKQRPSSIISLDTLKEDLRHAVHRDSRQYKICKKGVKVLQRGLGIMYEEAERAFVQIMNELHMELPSLWHMNDMHKIQNRLDIRVQQTISEYLASLTGEEEDN